MKMEGIRNRVLGLIMVVAKMLSMVNGELFYVGGFKEAWKPNVNFSQWSSRQHFHVGDWLYFGFDKNMYNVLEVNKTSYANCNDQGFIKNITKGGRDVYELTQPKTYYFICGRGFCYGGMKVAIKVEDIPPSPSPSPKTNNAPLSSPIQYGFITLSVLFISSLLRTIL